MMHKQIKDLFTNPENTMYRGLWMDGTEGEGKWKDWHENGKLSEQCFYKNGKKEGECKTWWANGKISYHYFRKNGKIDGEFKEWDTSGNLTSSKIYKDGREV